MADQNPYDPPIDPKPETDERGDDALQRESQVAMVFSITVVTCAAIAWLAATIMVLM